MLLVYIYNITVSFFDKYPISKNTMKAHTTIDIERIQVMHYRYCTRSP